MKSKNGNAFGKKVHPGELADQLYATRQERYELQHQADKLKENEKALSEKLRAALLKIKGNSVGGKQARVTLETKPVPRVVNWDAFYEHIRKTGEFDLLQRRPSDEAIKERWEHKDAKRHHVPGVQAENVSKLSVEKL